MEDGKLLFDFHSFPLRIVEVRDQPHHGVLRVGYADAIFLKSRGGVTPSGWSCEHLPYLVEFDNFGRSNPGKPSKSPFIWGWDEITWFALQPEAERNLWLRYAWKWVKETDPNGHLQMPGSRVMTPGKPDAPDGTGPTREVMPARRVSTPKTRSRRSGGRDSCRAARGIVVEMSHPSAGSQHHRPMWALRVFQVSVAYFRQRVTVLASWSSGISSSRAMRAAIERLGSRWFCSR